MESQVNPVNAERENNIDSKLFLPKLMNSRVIYKAFP